VGLVFVDFLRETENVKQARIQSDYIRVSVTSHEMFKTKPEVEEDKLKPASLKGKELCFNSALTGSIRIAQFKRTRDLFGLNDSKS